MAQAIKRDKLGIYYLADIPDEAEEVDIPTIEITPPRVAILNPDFAYKVTEEPEDMKKNAFGMDVVPSIPKIHKPRAKKSATAKRAKRTYPKRKPA